MMRLDPTHGQRDACRHTSSQVDGQGCFRKGLVVEQATARICSWLLFKYLERFHRLADHLSDRSP